MLSRGDPPVYSIFRHTRTWIQRRQSPFPTYTKITHFRTPRSDENTNKSQRSHIGDQNQELFHNQESWFNGRTLNISLFIYLYSSKMWKVSSCSENSHYSPWIAHAISKYRLQELILSQVLTAFIKYCKYFPDTQMDSKFGNKTAYFKSYIQSEKYSSRNKQYLFIRIRLNSRLFFTRQMRWLLIS